MKPKWKRVIWIAPLGIVGMVVFISLGGLIVRALWNWLLPGIFGLNTITFWQALGLLVLCRILFGGLGMRSSGGSRMRARMQERMAERCERMTPEEREKFRQAFYSRWGRVAPPEDPKPNP